MLQYVSGGGWWRGGAVPHDVYMETKGDNRKIKGLWEENEQKGDINVHIFLAP